MYLKSLELLLCCFLLHSSVWADKYKIVRSEINFISEAPLEIISAKSTDLRGIIDTENKQFVFKVKMNSFEGFNSPLQLEHYNENYIESKKYPEAQFSGKILDDFDSAKQGVYHVRAKGKFTLHGVSREKIFLSKLTILKNGLMRITAEIELKLSEFDIDVPQIVNHKIAEVIKVKIDCELKKL